MELSTAEAVHLSENALVRTKITALRNQETDARSFRQLVHELGLLLAGEALASLPTRPVEVTTPLRKARGEALAGAIALAPVLRAGLGLVEPFLQVLGDARVWHLGLYRDEETLRPVEYYPLKGAEAVACAVVLDPMLATGGTAVAAIEAVRRTGTERIVLASLIGAPEGVAAVQEAHPGVPVHLAALDEGLDERGYIVPGLGDAGDRQFGT